jgi:hypothetical protein
MGSEVKKSSEKSETKTVEIYYSSKETLEKGKPYKFNKKLINTLIINSEKSKVQITIQRHRNDITKLYQKPKLISSSDDYEEEDDDEDGEDDSYDSNQRTVVTFLIQKLPMIEKKRKGPSSDSEEEEEEDDDGERAAV